MTEAVFNSFSQSIERLAEVLKQPKTVITRDSAIKRFELTFEVACRSAKRYLGGRYLAMPLFCLRQHWLTGGNAQQSTQGRPGAGVVLLVRFRFSDLSQVQLHPAIEGVI
jgi:hypothetical protein